MKSSPVVSMVATAEEREQQLFAHMGKPRLSKAMDKYFLATPSKYEAKISKPTRKLGTEAAMREIAHAIKDVAQRWTNIKQLVDILRHHFGLHNQFNDFEVAAEEAKLGELWGPSGTMSHEAIISEIERLFPLL
ncbi:BQ5605_C003g01838 [Microbotryum silenes-dioicae]|uniref:BQ5605_C003g01838 protein n=1 Tax=Microbotryum silenes-dioicae TaxID=796604 RepID=A0A2X0LZW6_9BASI|nr:BQ5605_C003g01838 [Microbotryum silenes-dioicae]